jgi:hypothetical protein
MSAGVVENREIEIICAMERMGRDIFLLAAEIA